MLEECQAETSPCHVMAQEETLERERTTLGDFESRGMRTPKRYYKNKASWELAQIVKTPSLYLEALIGLFNILIQIPRECFRTEPRSKWEIVALSVGFGMLYQPPVLKIEEVVKLQTDQLCKEVVEGTPGMRVEQWDLVVQRFNEFIHAARDWTTISCLFDGYMCHSLFRKLVVHPANKRFLAMQSQLAKADAGAVNLSSKGESLTDEFSENCEEHGLLARASTEHRTTKDAPKRYESDVRDWWVKNTRAEKHGSLSITCAKLPKEVSWSKVGWQFTMAMAALVQTRAFVPISLFSWIVFGVTCTNGTVFYVVLGALLSNVFGGIVLFSPLRDSDVDARDLMELWASIVIVKPHGDTRDWDCIASHMNEYLVTAGAAGRAAQFYDGENCMQRFKKRYSASLLEKKRWGGGNFEDL